MEGCPCPACAAGHPRGYLRYLVKSRELTGLRLLTLHNLALMARLMADLREAVEAGTLAERARALRAGAPPLVADGHPGAPPGEPATAALAGAASSRP